MRSDGQGRRFLREEKQKMIIFLILRKLNMRIKITITIFSELNLYTYLLFNIKELN